MEKYFAHMRRMIPLLLVLFFVAGCGTGAPVEKLRRDLDRYPEYSIILQDMTTKGLIFHDYFHRYLLIYAQGNGKAKQDGTPDFAQKITDWIKVDKQIYENYESALGMTVLAKKQDGTIDRTPQPTAYQFVGDPRFGRWETDNRGNQGWAWLAAGMVLSRVIDEVGGYERRRPGIDYGDWQEYRKSKSKGVPYYGKKDNQGRPQFGTRGTVTEKKSPSFFERQQQRMADRKTTFGQKVESRMGRTKVSPGRSSTGGFSKSMGGFSKSFGRSRR